MFEVGPHEAKNPISGAQKSEAILLRGRHGCDDNELLELLVYNLLSHGKHVLLQIL